MSNAVRLTRLDNVIEVCCLDVSCPLEGRTDQLLVSGPERNWEGEGMRKRGLVRSSCLDLWFGYMYVHIIQHCSANQPSKKKMLMSSSVNSSPIRSTSPHFHKQVLHTVLFQRIDQLNNLRRFPLAINRRSQRRELLIHAITRERMFWLAQRESLLDRL